LITFAKYGDTIWSTSSDTVISP